MRPVAMTKGSRNGTDSGDASTATMRALRNLFTPWSVRQTARHGKTRYDSSGSHEGPATSPLPALHAGAGRRGCAGRRGGGLRWVGGRDADRLGAAVFV